MSVVSYNEAYDLLWSHVMADDLNRVIMVMSHECHGILNHWQFGCLLKQFVPAYNKVTWKLCIFHQWPGWALSQYNNYLSRYGYFHYKDKKLYNGNPYTGKTASLYWDAPCGFYAKQASSAVTFSMSWCHMLEKSLDEACCLAAIAGATVLVPYHVVKSLQLIWRSGTHRWTLLVPDLLGQGHGQGQNWWQHQFLPWPWLWPWSWSDLMER